MMKLPFSRNSEYKNELVTRVFTKKTSIVNKLFTTNSTLIFGYNYTFRWHLEMPSILEGSILIMSRAGTGTAMFSMGETALIFSFLN